MELRQIKKSKEWKFKVTIGHYKVFLKIECLCLE